MTPSPAFPNPENEEEKTDKALGHTMRYIGTLLRDPKVWAILGLMGVGAVRETTRTIVVSKPTVEQGWTLEEMRSLIREENEPLQADIRSVKACLRAYFKASKDKIAANEALQAMYDERDKLRRGK